MERPITAKFNETENRWDVTAVGEVDIYNSTVFKDSLLALTKEREADLFVDCAGLRYIDSTGLGALVAVLKSVKTYGGEVYLNNVKKTVAKLFRITNLDKAFVISAADDSDAKAAVKPEPKAESDETAEADDAAGKSGETQ